MTITLYYHDLKHDMDQWSYRASEGRITDANVLDDAQQDDNYSSKTLCLRLFEGGVAHLKALIGSDLDFTVSDKNDKLGVNAATDFDATTWTFVFKDDVDISADCKAIAEAFHRFVFLHAFRDWAVLYAPDSVKNVEGLLTDAETEVTSSLYSLDAPTKHRRKLIEDQVKSTIEIEEES